MKKILALILALALCCSMAAVAETAECAHEWTTETLQAAQFLGYTIVDEEFHQGMWSEEKVRNTCSKCSDVVEEEVHYEGGLEAHILVKGVCAKCGYGEPEAEATPAPTENPATERYKIDVSEIKLNNKTTGTGYVNLTEGVQPQSTRYVFIQWTWNTKAGDQIVADTCVPMKDLGNGKFSFNAKSVTVGGATMDNFIMIVTDDENAVDFSCNQLGLTVMTKASGWVPVSR